MIVGLDEFTIALIGVTGLLTIWIGVLTYQMQSLKRHYRQLIGNSKKADLQNTLDSILKSQKEADHSLSVLTTHIGKLEKDVAFHLQCVGFKRFNPFGDTGGDQSFALALLDKYKTGLVFSFLHSREVTRVYAKQIVKGVSKEMALSNEEKEVVEKAARFGA